MELAIARKLPWASYQSLATHIRCQGTISRASQYPLQKNRYIRADLLNRFTCKADLTNRNPSYQKAESGQVWSWSLRKCDILAITLHLDFRGQIRETDLAQYCPFSKHKLHTHFPKWINESGITDTQCFTSNYDWKHTDPAAMAMKISRNEEAQLKLTYQKGLTLMDRGWCGIQESLSIHKP